MVSYFIKDVDSAKKLVSVCEKYEEAEIDVIYGRQIIDGKSILGVMSLIGKIVSININSQNKNNKDKFEKEIKDAV